MHILGISAYYHDSAACLVRDGEVLAAAQEERFSRKKHDHRFPTQAVDFCLRHAGITINIKTTLMNNFVKVSHAKPLSMASGIESNAAKHNSSTKFTSDGRAVSVPSRANCDGRKMSSVMRPSQNESTTVHSSDG